MVYIISRTPVASIGRAIFVLLDWQRESPAQTPLLKPSVKRNARAPAAKITKLRCSRLSLRERAFPVPGLCSSFLSSYRPFDRSVLLGNSSFLIDITGTFSVKK